ncbi:ABC transporter substrate-binding protein [Bifidobacterium platyrrhinorum]|uniref:Solute-binding protein family 5 domain-containing protein n=1 Tax=Bifidobacterium platyrrhinorum TaxID=2661628 RepID=A0A6L9STS2_9BIFI|nr:ABC transporter substrate-binding protein [Bifidobacterium platyrrhinorum]NEG55183.1 hypothetical protein [Bifidobacterium platyrrhinorum]
MHIGKKTGERTIAAIAGLVLTSLLVAGCGSAGAGDASNAAAGDSASVQKGGTLVWGSRSEPGNGGLDPYVASVYRSTAVLALTYETLVVKNDSGKIEPALATKWEQPDATTYRFTIRDGVKFSDGSALTLDDVVWSFKHHKEVNGAGDEALANLKDVKAVGDHDVEFTFSEPVPGFLNLISRRTGSYFIVKQGWYEKADSKTRQTKTVGTGPFTVSEWNHGVDLKLVKNKHYWEKGVPYLDGIDFKITGGDEQTLLSLVQQGSVDAAWFWDPELAAQAENAGFTKGKDQYTSARSLWIDPNYGNGALKDVRVRRAISEAIDREQLIKLGANGVGALSFATPPAFNELKKPGSSTPYYKYDPSDAKKLLKQAGAENLTISVTYGSDASSQTDVSILQLIAKQLSKVGVNLKLNGVPYSEVQNVFTTGADFPSELVWVVGTKGADAASSYHSWLDDSGKVSHWQGNADAEKAKSILAQARKESDSAKRAKLLDQLNEEVADKVLILNPLATPLDTQLWSSKVHGFSTDSEDARANLKYTWIEH